MEFFDLRTAYLVISALNIFVPLFTWVALRPARDLSALFWCLGGGISAIGAVLVSSRAFLPAWVALSLGNLFLVSAIFLRIRSLELLRERQTAMGIDIVLVLLVAVMVEFVRNVLGSTPSNLNMALHALIHGRLAYVAYRVAREREQPIVYWISGSYWLVATSLMYNVMRALVDDQAVDYLAPTLANRLLLLLGAVTTAINYIGYVGLVLQLSKRRELAMVEQASRQEVSLRLGAQLAHLQRQQMVGQMSAYFAHEVRQPLTALISTAQLAGRGLRSERMGAAQVLPLIDRIVTGARRVESIVERVLAQVKHRDLERRTLDLHELLDEVIELVQAEARTRQVGLLKRSNPARVLVAGDAVQLAQVLLNVIRNGLEAAAQGEEPRRVEVDLIIRQEEVVVEIVDSGRGFSAEALEHAGRPFFTTKLDGVGVGLSVSTEIVRQHGGTLEWCNAGRGARVELRLPLSPRDACSTW